MKILIATLAFILLLMHPIFGQVISSRQVSNVETELVQKYGEGQKERIHRGLQQAARLWRAEDGNEEAFSEFARANFAGDEKTLDQTFERLETQFEQLDGRLTEIGRDFNSQKDLDLGPILPVDNILSAYDPFAHLNDDFFQNKLAFLVLLNFPVTTLEERLANGASWTSRQWAEARLTDRFLRRVPSEVNMESSRVYAEADRYIAEYNIWMRHILTEDGARLFPAKMKLISHWNLRDELKADYNGSDGPAKQKLIQAVMERIVTQTIPAIVINNPHVDWKPVSNQVTPAGEDEGDSLPPEGMKVTSDREPDTRYDHLLAAFHAARKADPYSPGNPTFIDRSFNEDRQIPETRVRQMLVEVVSSPLIPRVAKLISARLHRPLEPYDIWYNGFQARGKYAEAELDRIVSQKYPNAEAFSKDIPNILQKFGFSPERARFVAGNIVVDPSRGAGHAAAAGWREDKAHLRTRVEKTGMNYKGYNIAIHEMGHNVEETFSLHDVPHTLMRGVPNNAFTEALAMVLQGHDLELLGLTDTDGTARSMKIVGDLWSTYEISGIALVDMAIWHWMYDHPNATAAELRQAGIQICIDIWNRYYAPVIGKKDSVILGIYSQMIYYPLYTPNYSMGEMIGFQVSEQFDKAGKIGPEFERMAGIGAVTPDLWMIKATGAPVGPGALLRAAEKALDGLEKNTVE